MAYGAAAFAAAPNCHVDIKESDVVTFVAGQPLIDQFELTNGHDFIDLLAQCIGEKIHETNLRTDDLRIIIYANYVSTLFMRTIISNWAGGKAALLFAS